MIERIKKFLGKIADSLLDPLLQWVLTLKWWKRFLIFLAILSIFGLIKYHDKVSKWVSSIERLYRIVRVDSKTPPLREIDQKRLNNYIEYLAIALKVRFDQLEDYPEQQAWNMAQISAALGGHTSISSKSARAYLDSHIGPNCFCWRKYPLVQYPPNIAVSSWVLFAMSRLRQAASVDQLKFLLDNQN